MYEMIYCVKCKAKTPTIDMRRSFSIKNTPMVKGKCSKCGCKKCVFVEKEKSSVR